MIAYIQLGLVDRLLYKPYTIIKVDNFYRSVKIALVILIITTLLCIKTEDSLLESLIICYIVCCAIANCINIYLISINRDRYDDYLREKKDYLINLHMYLNNGNSYEDFGDYIIETVDNNITIILKESYYINLFKKRAQYSPLEEIQYYSILFLYCICFVNFVDASIFYIIDHQLKR